MGRPSIAPGVYFRMMLIGYFEGIDSERGIAWRCADSLSLKSFLGYCADGDDTGSLDDVANAAIDRCGDARPNIHVDAASVGETWIDRRQDDRIDATTLEANAAMRSIVRRDTGESYTEFLTKTGQGQRNRNADARRLGEVGSEESRRRDPTRNGNIPTIRMPRSRR